MLGGVLVHSSHAATSRGSGPRGAAKVDEADNRAASARAAEPAAPAAGAAVAASLRTPATGVATSAAQLQAVCRPALTGSCATAYIDGRA